MSHQCTERRLYTLGVGPESILKITSPSLLVIPHPAVSPDRDIIPSVDELGVFSYQYVVVVREVLANAEALKSIGYKVFTVREISDERLMNDDGISGQTVDTVPNSSGRDMKVSCDIPKSGSAIDLVMDSLIRQSDL